MNSLTFFGLSIQIWYNSLVLPPWAPPVWMFSAAWAVIYTLMAISFFYVFWQSFITHQWRRYIGAIFAVNLLFNIIYGAGTYFAFRDGQNLAEIDAYYWPAAIIISLVLVTIPTMMVAVWDKAKWVALLQIPYLAWVLVATALQFTINFTN